MSNGRNKWSVFQIIGQENFADLQICRGRRQLLPIVSVMNECWMTLFEILKTPAYVASSSSSNAALQTVVWAKLAIE